ncbi:hypothetical protein HP550_18990 [Cellulomonas humilata]|uniref:Lipoprotein n=1 Tax=Cellulomonas humilata TaxID=144055 RepID=A0A7Y6A5C5_9CELL|nr:hypothetical protein [Cellulomonas humilata]NUU19338.1 hypothetical protein [Cellulomonas humilata]
MTRAAALLVAAILVLGVTSCVPGASGASCQADYPSYGTTAELEDSADLIVRGTFTALEDDDTEGYPRTVAMVDVVATATGDATPGSALEIAYTRCDDAVQLGLEVGDEYVLLLSDPADDALPTPVNISQAFYPVEDGRAVATPDNPVELTPATLQALGLS